MAIVEAHHQFHVHPNLTARPANQAHKRGMFLAGNHEIRERESSVGGFEFGFKNEGSRTIAAFSLLEVIGPELPAPVLGISEQRSKAGAGVETGQTQPID